MKSIAKGVTLALVLLLVCIGVQGADKGNGELRVGSKRFTESYILAEIIAQKVGNARILHGLGNTAIVFEALRTGSIDLYPEYAGTISLEILKSPTPLPIDEMNRQLAPLGMGVAVPFGFNDGYALAMREADATRLGIRTLSDLAKHPDLRPGLSNEFLGRADGWRGLVARYSLPHKPVGIDHGLAYDAIGKGQVNVIDIYTTDAKIGHLKLRVLEDDLGYFPRYDALVLYRLDVPQRYAAAWQALQTLTNSVNEKQMIGMNARAELNGVAFDVIARDHLAGNSPAQEGARDFWGKLWGADLTRLTGQHLWLVLVSVGVAVLLAVPMAILVFPLPRWRALVLGITGLLQTIPALAMLAVLISLTGVVGTLPALLALTLYALLPIMRNTVTGLDGMPAGLRQAALALGLSYRDRLVSIDLPLALPTIIAGIRTATAIGVGMATIAAFIGAGGYGERIVTGLALNDRELLLAGAIPAAALAVFSELIFEGVERWVKRRHGC